MTLDPADPKCDPKKLFIQMLRDADMLRDGIYMADEIFTYHIIEQYSDRLFDAWVDLGWLLRQGSKFRLTGLGLTVAIERNQLG